MWSKEMRMVAMRTKMIYATSLREWNTKAEAGRIRKHWKAHEFGDRPETKKLAYTIAKTILRLSQKPNLPYQRAYTLGEFLCNIRHVLGICIELSKVFWWRAQAAQ